MDQTEKKPSEVSSEPDVETPIDEADLEVVTGGLASAEGGAALTSSCVTSAP